MEIWARLGITMNVSNEEYAVLIGENREKANDLFRNLINNGRFIPDGDAYIPGCALPDDPNSDYVPEDVNFDL